MKNFANFFLFLAIAGFLRADPPSNDQRADAIPVTLDEALLGTLAEATAETGEPGGQGQTVWYRCTAPAGERWEVRVTSYDSRFAHPAVYRLRDGGDLELLASGAFSRSETPDKEKFGSPSWAASTGGRFQSEKGEEFLIQVARLNWQFPRFELRLSQAGPLPPGTLFEDAPELPEVVREIEIPFSGSMLEAKEPTTEFAGSVWRSWVLPEGGKWLVLSSSWYPQDALDVWKGDSLENLERAAIGSSKMNLDEESSYQVFRGEAGERVWIRLTGDGYGNRKIWIQRPAEGDFFEDAIQLPSGPRFYRSVSALDNLTSEEATEGTQAYPNRGRWFKWVAPESGRFEIRFKIRWGSQPLGLGSSRPMLRVYQGNTRSDLRWAKAVPLGSVEGLRRFETSIGLTYYFELGLTYGEGGFTVDNDRRSTLIELVLKPLGPGPANDDFANATVFGESLPDETSGTNVGASLDDGESAEWYRASDTVWHRWEVDRTGDYELIFSSVTRLELGALRGTEIGERKRVFIGKVFGQNDVADHKRFRFAAAAGETLNFRIVGDGSGEQGPYSLSLRKLERPDNADIAKAIPLTGVLPLRVRGTTKDASRKPGIEEWLGLYGEEASVIWWKWKAPESGFFEVHSEGSVLFSNGEAESVLSNRNKDEIFRFRAEQDREYFLGVGQYWDDEGEVSLSLARVEGLDHATAETAIPLGRGLDFSTELIATRQGPFWIGKDQRRAGVWYEWVPENSGMVSLDSGGSDGPVILSVYRDGEEMNTYRAGEKESEVLLRELSTEDSPLAYPDRTTRGFLRNRILREASLRRPMTRRFFEAVAGQKYYLVVRPQGAAAELTRVKLTMQRTGAEPWINQDGVTWQLSDDLTFFTVTIPVISPNGFAFGELSTTIGSAGFTEGHRVSGDAYRGEYRVVLRRRPRSVEITQSAQVFVMDRVGGSSNVWLNRVTVAASPIDDGDMDLIRPEWEGLSGGPMEIKMSGGQEVRVVRFAISDRGGSGLAKGEVRLPDGGLPDYGGERRGVFTFGPENRVQGEMELGIYEVEMEVPGDTPAGKAWVHLRDHDGNSAGTTIYPPSPPRRGLNVFDHEEEVEFRPGIEIPLTISRGGEIAEMAPVISDVNVRWSGGRLLATLSVNDAAGCGGGQVILADDLGVVAAVKAFGEKDRVSGSMLEGIYEVILPTPLIGLGGRHWVTVQAVGVQGGLATLMAAEPVDLPTDHFGDRRAPALSRIQIDPAEVDLTAGPATIAVHLSANDDLPGTEIEVRVLDNESRLLGRTELICSQAETECTTEIVLPRNDNPGLSGIARIVVTMRDLGGRLITLGEAGGGLWPDRRTPQLRIGPDRTDRLRHWQNRWLGEPGGSALADRDHDGWSDLLEFALGTDPLVAASHDVLRPRLPKHTFTEIGYGASISAQVTFRPAPWFEKPRDDFELFAESTGDLSSWELTDSQPIVPRDGTARASRHFPRPQRAGWLRVGVRKK